MKIQILFVFLALLMACNNGTDSSTNTPGLTVVSGPCAKVLAKSAAKQGILTYAEKDSIGFIFNATLNCGATYAYHSALIDSRTLSLSAEDVGDTRARCVCARDLTVNLKSMYSEDYSSVHTLVFYTDTIELVPRLVRGE